MLDPYIIQFILLGPLVAQFTATVALGVASQNFWLAAVLAGAAVVARTDSTDLLWLLGAPATLLGVLLAYLTPPVVTPALGASAGAYFGSLLLAWLFASVGDAWELPRAAPPLAGRMAVALALLPAAGGAAFCARALEVSAWWGASLGLFALFALLAQAHCRPGRPLLEPSAAGDHPWTAAAKRGLNGSLGLFVATLSRPLVGG